MVLTTDSFKIIVLDQEVQIETYLGPETFFLNLKWKY